MRVNQKINCVLHYCTVYVLLFNELPYSQTVSFVATSFSSITITSRESRIEYFVRDLISSGGWKSLALEAITSSDSEYGAQRTVDLTSLFANAVLFIF